MKYYYNLFFVLYSSFVFSQNNVGINTVNPTQSLDINGSLKVREIDESVDIQYVLAMDSKGVIFKTDIKKFENAIEEVVVSDLAPNVSSVISNDTNLSEASIIITSSNNCNRQMITSFISYGNALSFINGIARMEFAVPSATLGDYSPIWTIKFNTASCSGDGDSTQFDFSFEKINTFQYKVTNKGNVRRSYNISFMKI